MAGASAQQQQQHRPAPRRPFGRGGSVVRQLPPAPEPHATEVCRLGVTPPVQLTEQPSLQAHHNIMHTAGRGPRLGNGGGPHQGAAGALVHSTQHMAPMLPLGWEAGFRDSANDPRQARRRRRRPTPTRGVLMTSPAQTSCPPGLMPAAQLHPGQLDPMQQQQAFLLGFAQQEAADSGASRLWVVVRQHEPGGPADVFIHDTPVDEAAGLMLPRAISQEPLMTIYNSSFTRCPIQRGPWHNYPIQFRGDFFLQHEQIEWPNEIRLYEPCMPQQPSASASNILPYGVDTSPDATATQGRMPATAWQTRRARRASVAPADVPLAGDRYSHALAAAALGSSSNSSSSSSSSSGDLGSSALTGGARWAVQRSKGNYSGLDDIVVWLSDPTPERIAAHLANLVRSGLRETLARGISPEMVYGRLATQWGSPALVQLGFTRVKVTQMVTDPMTPHLHPVSCPRPHMVCTYKDSLDQELHAHTELQTVSGSRYSMQR